MPTNDATNDVALEPVRFSRLKLFGKSAAHYACNASDDTSSLRKGSALHSYLLGDADKVAVYTGKKRDKRVKAYQEFLENHPGADILNAREFEAVDGMRKAILAHDRARQLLAGVREQRITWDTAGRDCAGTPDVVHLNANGTKVLVELKTSVSSSPGLFKWQGKKLGYPAQVAWYADGLERTMLYKPGPVTAIYVVAVESAPPFNVVIYPVTERLRVQGRKQWRIWFEQLLNCEASGNFPGYAESDVEWDAEDEDLVWDEEAA